MIDVTLENFEAEVIAASMAVPVLVDIWAPWCGPCKSLGPVLEQVETEYAGRFILVKLDADKVPEIAGQLSQLLGVRSIPLCVLFKGGQPVDGFVGAVPADEVRAFLDKHVPGASEVAAEIEEDGRWTPWPPAIPTRRWKSCNTQLPPTRPTTKRVPTTSSCCCNWAAKTTPKWPLPR